MQLSINIYMHKGSNISRRFIGIMKSLYYAAIKRKDGRAQPKIEEPDEENMDYDGIMPGREGTPDTGAEPEKENPEDPDPADVSVPKDAASQNTYSGEREEALPADITDSETEFSQEDLELEREEDLPPRPTGEEEPDKKEDDQNDKKEN
jgi:hypothetical protein